MKKQQRDMTEIIRGRYNRSARYYDLLDGMFKPALRRAALAHARGKVLEVGVGTGRNLEHYLEGCEVTGIDFSPGMLARARQKLAEARVPVTLMEMDAQKMDLPDDAFDTVVATCVFCSVPDPVRGLEEVRRVSKPGGRIILLEHVRSEHPVIGVLMDFLNPVSLFMVGSNINRHTVENVRKAGLKITSVEDRLGKILKLIVATPG